VTTPETIFGLVLAGGNSRRMGRDKAALLADGETQLQRAVRLLDGHLGRVFVSTAAHQAGDPLRQNFAQIVDRYTDIGPVAGIMSALEEYPQNAWLVMACDLPNVDDQTIAYLLQHVSTEHAVTAFRSVNDGLPEPLCAIYRPAAYELIMNFVADGIHCPRKMLINSPTCLLTQPRPGALHNVNTPGDLAGTSVKLAS